MEIRTDIAAAVVEEVNKLTGKELGWSAHTDIDTNRAYTKIVLRSIDKNGYDRRLTLHIIENRIRYGIEWKSEVYVPEHISRITNFSCYEDAGKARLEDIPILLSERLEGKGYRHEDPKKEKLPYIDPAKLLNKCSIELGELWNELLTEVQGRKLIIRSRDYDEPYGIVLEATTTDTEIQWYWRRLDEPNEFIDEPNEFTFESSGTTTIAWFPSLVKSRMFDDITRSQKNWALCDYINTLDVSSDIAQRAKDLIKNIPCLPSFVGCKTGFFQNPVEYRRNVIELHFEDPYGDDLLCLIDKSCDRVGTRSYDGRLAGWVDTKDLRGRIINFHLNLLKKEAEREKDNN